MAARRMDKVEDEKTKLDPLIKNAKRHRSSHLTLTGSSRTKVLTFKEKTMFALDERTVHRLIKSNASRR